MNYSDKLFLFLFFGVLIIAFSFLVSRLIDAKAKESNISAYEEEQKQIYEAKLRRWYD